MGLAAKYRFSLHQRYAVHTVHDGKCYICGHDIDLLETTVDHVIPSSLLQKPEKLQTVFLEFGLPADFELNDYSNWMPCCHPCNNWKRARVFRRTPLFENALRTAGAKAVAATELEARTIDDRETAELLNALDRSTSLRSIDIQLIDRFAKYVVDGHELPTSQNERALRSSDGNEIGTATSILTFTPDGKTSRHVYKTGAGEIGVTVSSDGTIRALGEEELSGGLDEKVQRSPHEYFAVYSVYGGKCSRCGKPLDVLSLNIAEIIPSRLKKEPDRFQAILTEFGLPPDFALDTYHNWTPTCRSCSEELEEEAFDSTLETQLRLEYALEKALEAKRHEARTLSNNDTKKILSALQLRYNIRAIDLAIADYVSKLEAPDLTENRSGTTLLPVHGLAGSMERGTARSMFVHGPNGKTSRSGKGLGFMDFEVEIDGNERLLFELTLYEGRIDFPENSPLGSLILKEIRFSTGADWRPILSINGSLEMKSIGLDFGRLANFPSGLTIGLPAPLGLPTIRIGPALETPKSGGIHE